MLTHSCNLRCAFCYAQKTLCRSEDRLSFSDVKHIVDCCENAGIKFIVLTGGEPTLYPDLFNTLHYIKTRKSSMLSALTTNGIKLGKRDFCNRLIESGLGYVDISLKGEDSAACAKTTTIDCFEDQMKALETAKSGSLSSAFRK